MFQDISAHRAVGALFLAAALSEYLFLGNIRFIQAGLGLAFLFVQETAKIDLLRLGVFCWAAVSLLLVVAAAIYASTWIRILPVVLFGGGIIGLLLEGNTQRQVLGFSAVATCGLIISWLI